jgi:electron transport complex protein RnfB
MCVSKDEDRIIIPLHKALEIVGKARKAYVRECLFRSKEIKCPRDNWEVCLLFENTSKDTHQNARPITSIEALSILEQTAKRKSIYNLFYTHAGHNITEICCCCTCCCHPLHKMREDGNYDKQLRSEYAAITDETRYVGCASCERSCLFEARQIENGKVYLLDERCFGCGKCIESCPEHAIRLERKFSRGVPIPTYV